MLQSGTDFIANKNGHSGGVAFKIYLGNYFRNNFADHPKMLHKDSMQHWRYIPKIITDKRNSDNKGHTIK
jgi:hypothetical protein